MARSVSDDVVEYTLVSERDEEKPFTVRMRRLPRPHIAAIKDGTVDISNKGKLRKLRSSTVAYELTLAQLDGWKNLMNGDQELKFEASKKAELYDMLDGDIQDELEAVFGSGRKDDAAEERYVKDHAGVEDDEDEDEDDE